MFRPTFYRLLACLGFLGVFLYSYIDRHNAITKLRLEIPKLSAERRELQEKEQTLLFRISSFESPENLLELSKKPQFSYLKVPLHDEVTVLQERSFDELVEALKEKYQKKSS